MSTVSVAVARHPASTFSRRVIDLVVAGLGLLILSPLLLVLALCIKLYDGGPVLYVSPRVGKAGDAFDFLKFRSMVVGAEHQKDGLDNEAEGPLFKLANDPRVTPIGRVIRRWSIDELPQLWNVIRGDMHLVGPRPLPVPDLEGFRDHPDYRRWFDVRTSVHPGITGLWQIRGRSDLPFADMAALDERYVLERSLWLDVLVLAGTVPAVLRGRGAH